MANDGPGPNPNTSPTPTPTNAMQKRIGIIGAGPAGLAALKMVLDAPEYAAGLWAPPVVLEAREDVGGVWLPAPSSFPHPSSTSSSSGASASTDALPPPPPPPATPLYDALTTNLPHPVMAFSSFPFPPCTPLFPPARVVHAYLAAYADEFRLREHVRLREKVVGVRWEGGAWAVTTEAKTEAGEKPHAFDLLLICTGHHAAPHYPAERAMPGLAAWLTARSAFHSVFYRNPGSIPLSSSLSTSCAMGLDLENAAVLIIGNGPSGTDIAAELAPRARRVLLAASSYVPPSAPPPDGKKKATENKPLPVRFGPAPSSTGAGTVYFADGTRAHVDFCVLATGYEVDFPFFDQSLPESPVAGTSARGQQRFALPKGVLPRPLPADDAEKAKGRKLTNSGRSVFPLARHLFPLPGFFERAERAHEHEPEEQQTRRSPHPTSLAFLGLPVRVAPLPLVEAQARAAVGAWAWCCGAVSDVDGEFGEGEGEGLEPQPEKEKERKTRERELDWAREEQDIRARWAELEGVWAGGGGGVVRAGKDVGMGSGEEKDERGKEDGEEDKEKRAFIAKHWHRLPEEAQFAYRDALDAFAFSLRASSSTTSSPSPPPSQEPTPKPKPHKVRPWEARIYAQKAPLRAAWRALEARGDGSAERWVEGVGLGGTRRAPVRGAVGGEGDGASGWEEGEDMGKRERQGEDGDGDGDTMTPEEEWVDMMERLLAWWAGEGAGAGAGVGGV